MVTIHSSLIRLMVVLTFVIGVLMGLAALRFWDDDFREFLFGLRLPERLDTYASSCQKTWADGPISEIIQQRLHKHTPQANKIIALKSNAYGWNSLKVFSIDARQGYAVQMTSDDFPTVREKTFEKSTAEQIFSRLTEGEQRDIPGKDWRENYVILHGGPSCEFLKLVYPTDAVQVDFIEAPLGSSHEALYQTHTGLRMLRNIQQFFLEIQAESETQQASDSYADERIYLWRMKKQFQDRFFELPKSLD